ncbi:MAG: type VI secretion system baseplate subunit TssF [Alphaproteobacteria bacterium]|nr:type VI secretion system baseplate subunit TssF [Alphaproteobacteria bacterium]
MSRPHAPRSPLRYFQEERDYLRHMGREFAASHPAVAGLLHGEGDDPSVERLLQGVAFLTARVRQRLDAELPELSHELFRLMWPHVLRPIPSMAIQRFTPPDGLGWTLRIPRGTVVRSRPIDTDGQPVRCPFRTVYDVELPPVRLVSARVEADRVGDRLRLDFQLAGGLELGAMPDGEVSRLRLHIDGRKGPLAREVLYFILHRLRPEGVLLRPTPAREGAPRPLPPPQPVGFAPEDALLPGWRSTPEPYRLLHEYASLPDKLLFIDITGIGPLAALGEGTGFSLEFPFDQELPQAGRVDASLFLLGCTPVVNLFSASAVFRRRRPVLDEYLLRPRSDQRDRFEVFSVDEVTSVVERSPGRERYEPLLACSMSPQGRAPGARWYQERVRVDLTQDKRARTRTWLRLSLPDDPNKDETFTVRLTCTNGRIPADLSGGQVDDGAGLPAGVNTGNLAAPTPPVPPPLDQELEWQLLSHLTVSRASLASADALQRLLTLYGAPIIAARADARRLHQRRMEAIRSVRLEVSERLVAWPGGQGRTWCRGGDLRIDLDMARFGGPGDCFLFGLVLDRVLAHWVTMNAFSRLVLEDIDNADEPVIFAPRLGDRPLL